jgi:hypothetical protein
MHVKTYFKDKTWPAAKYSSYGIDQFVHEPCFFSIKISLEDRGTEWSFYRLRVERDKQKFMTIRCT